MPRRPADQVAARLEKMVEAGVKPTTRLVQACLSLLVAAVDVKPPVFVEPPSRTERADENVPLGRIDLDVPLARVVLRLLTDKEQSISQILEQLAHCGRFPTTAKVSNTLGALVNQGKAERVCKGIYRRPPAPA